MRRITAWILALVMLLSPVSASAVTWGEICAGLKNGSFSKDGVSAETKDGTTTVQGGNVEDVNISQENIPSAMVVFKNTNITGEFVLRSRNGEQYIVTLENGTTVNVEDFSVSTQGSGSSATLINKGDITSTDLMFSMAFDGGRVEVINEGSMTADEYWHVLARDEYKDYYEDNAGESSSATVINKGTFTGNLHGSANETSHVELQNSGNVNGDFLTQTSEESTSTIINSGTVSGQMDGWSTDASTVNMSNTGTVTGELMVTATDEAHINAVNSGTVKGGANILTYGTSDPEYQNGAVASFDNRGGTVEEIMAYAHDGANLNIQNSGVVKKEFLGNIEKGELHMTNSGTVEGDFLSNVTVNAVGEMINSGDVKGAFYGLAASDGQLHMTNSGTVGEDFFADTYQEGKVSAENKGTVGASMIGFVQENTQVSLNNSGHVQEEIFGSVMGNAGMEIINSGTVGREITVQVMESGNVKVSNSGDNMAQTKAFFSVLPYEGKYATMQQIYDKGSEIVATIDVSGLTVEQVDGIVSNYSGSDYEVVYEIALGEDGKLYLVLLEEEDDDDDDDEEITEERYRHRMEVKRKEESIAGVYASPYWCKQLSLGYTNQNLWIHNESGKKINFRERLAWVGDGTPAKRLNLRVNLEDPTGVNMRFDGSVFATLERTEIERLTILDKNGNVYMDYVVSELKAAREAFGLAQDDLLIVGGTNDPVMKMGADGVIRPVEEE